MFWPSPSISNVRTAMLVEHVAALPQGEEWEYEYSWPGERVLAIKDSTRVRLISVLHRRDMTNRFPVVAAAMAKLGAAMAVIDGVIRAIDSAAVAVLVGGTASPIPTVGIRLIATDVLWVDAVDARKLPLTERKERLRIETEGTGILVGLPINGSVADLRAEAERIGADGIVAKRRDSRYRPFARMGDWLRLPLVGSGASRAKRGAGGASHREHRRLGKEPSTAFGGWGSAMT